MQEWRQVSAVLCMGRRGIFLQHLKTPALRTLQTRNRILQASAFWLWCLVVLSTARACILKQVLQQPMLDWSLSFQLACDRIPCCIASLHSVPFQAFTRPGVGRSADHTFYFWNNYCSCFPYIRNCVIAHEQGSKHQLQCGTQGSAKLCVLSSYLP